MRRISGGFGVVLLAIVVAVVLLLAARAWNAVAPTAADVRDASAPVPADVRDAASSATRDGSLPRLDDVRQRTGAHAEEIANALAQTD